MADIFPNSGQKTIRGTKKMLKITKITKVFNKGTVDAKLALDNVSVDIKKGDFVSIIGANGAGKSTLFNAIAGSFYTDSGTIELDGRDITLAPEHKRAKQIGRLFQDPLKGTAPGMTIEEDDSLRRLFNTNADSMAIFGKRSAFTIILYKLLCVRWSIHWTICLQSTSQMKKSEQLYIRTRYLFLFLCFLKILL